MRSSSAYTTKLPGYLISYYEDIELVNGLRSMVPSEIRDRDRVHLIPRPSSAVSSPENDGRRVPARQLIPEDRDSTKSPRVTVYERSDDRPVDWRAR